MALNLNTARSICTATLLMVLAGCTTTVRTPFEVPEAEFSMAAATGGPLASLETAVHQRSGAALNAEEKIQDGGSESFEVSGFKLLNRSEDALNWRLALIDSATQSIDTQYYLYHGDSTGMLITSRLIDAADRGVKVRVIIDDMGTLATGKQQGEARDAIGTLMVGHPNITLRLFNSAENRKSLGWGLEFATHFSQLNHRMHNKSLIVDNRAVILGGRNIGDEYMGLSEALNFRDIDVLGVGVIARQTSAIFDLFWNSGWVISANKDQRLRAEKDFHSVRAEVLEELANSPQLEQFSVTPIDWRSSLEALTSSLHLGTSEVFTDRPQSDGISADLLEAVFEIVPKTQRELLITNAYFIPDEPGVAMLQQLNERGVDVKLHTNSLASQDVPAVNSHYKAWRGPMVDAGIALYEARHDAAIKLTVVDTAPMHAKVMGLHSKSMVIDRRFSIVGSANFDPRSALINSEMFAVIDSESLASALAEAIEQDISPANSWRVERDPKSRLIWRNSEETRTRQPSRSGWQRVQDWFFMLFPKSLY
ncbi:phospholipase D family protein [Luminiphilus sp. nBUS_16]|uniref:phospholipase D family protein n=1 Tax=Luminiphilus sp. nBUS_16 TaxID=3395315 RepID=UPI003EBD3E3F